MCLYVHVMCVYKEKEKLRLGILSITNRKLIICVFFHYHFFISAFHTGMGRVDIRSHHVFGLGDVISF